MPIRRLMVASFVLAVFCLSAFGPDGGTLTARQTPAAPAQQPTFRSKVDLIAVDVEVVDKEGRPVSALPPDKFTVMIDGRRRRVVSADFISYESRMSAGAGPGNASTTPSASTSPLGIPPRVTVLAVDCMSFNVALSRSVIEAAREFVLRTPADVRLGLFGFPLGPKVDPSTDRAPLLHALDKIVGQRDDPATSRYRLRPSEVVDLGPWSTGMGDLPDWAKDLCPPQDCMLEHEVKSLNLYYEAMARSSLNVLRGLLRDMRNWPGRKTVVLASAGMMTSDRPGGRPDLQGLDIEIGKEAALSSVGVYTLFMDQRSSEDNAAETSRGHKTISDLQRDSNLMGRWLDQFSGAAGGAMFNVLLGNGEFAFDRILTETSAYYLLGVAPEREDRDGRMHEINVKVSQPRVSVRGRAWVSIPASGTPNALASQPSSSPPTSAAAPRPAPSGELASMVAAFDRGEDDVVVRGVTQSPDQARLLRNYRTASPLWADTPRREAIFALDLAIGVLRSRNPALRDEAARLVLEADLAVRGPSGVDAFECQWYVTQAAAVQGLLQPDLGLTLVRQGRQRCQADAKLALAHGVLVEQFWAFSVPVTVPGQPAPALDPAQVAEAIEAYTAAARSPAVAEEARVRAAWLEYRTEQISRARALLSQNQPAPSNPRVHYLSSLITGHVLRGQHQFDEAAAAYRDAMAAYPGAQSARVALMTLLVGHGDRDQAESLAVMVPQAPAEAFDPWWTFWLGDYAAYPSLLVTLRGMAQ